MGKLGTYISNQIKTTRNTFRDPIIATVSVGMILALFVFVVWPLLMVVKQSFTDLDGNFSLQAYVNIVTMSETYQALVNTLMLAIIVGVLATSVGFLFAYCSSHLAIKGKKLFNLMALLPMVSPPFSVALSIIMLFGSRGGLEQHQHLRAERPDLRTDDLLFPHRVPAAGRHAAVHRPQH